MAWRPYWPLDLSVTYTFSFLLPTLIYFRVLVSNEKFVCFSFFIIQFQKLVCFSFFVIQFQKLACFSLFVFRYSNSNIFFQISCSQCYNSLLDFNQRKYLFTLNIKIEILFCFSFFVIRTLTFFQFNMLINLVWHAATSQISCSQCYNSIFTFNAGKCMYFEYQNRYFILFLFFLLFGLLTFFSVIMLKNVVRNAARSQIACSQCYNSLFTFTQRKYVFTLNIKIQIVFCFSSFGK